MPIIYNGETFSNGGSATGNLGDGEVSLSSIMVSIDGADPVEVWRRAVTLVNLVGNEAAIDIKVIDAGYNDMTHTMRTFTAINGHKYYCRASTDCVGAWTMGPTSTVFFDGTTVSSSGGNANTGHIVKTLSSGTKSATHRVYGSSVAGAYSACNANLYMMVDITPLEEATGITFTASSFWNYIGQTVFYGSKDFTP